MKNLFPRVSGKSACKSTPLIPGMRTSALFDAPSSSCGDARNASADGRNVHHVSERFDEISYRHADGCIIIDDGDDGANRQQDGVGKESGARFCSALLNPLVPENHTKVCTAASVPVSEFQRPRRGPDRIYRCRQSKVKRSARLVVVAGYP